MAKAKLTEKQRAIFEYIQDLIVSRGHAPTIREIGEAFGIRSTNGVRTHLTALIRKGLLKKQGFISRGLELARPLAGQVGRVPLVGSVPAGSPIDAIENIEGEIAVDFSFLPSGDSFSLKVTGDSMKNAGILDGDVVVVKKQETAVKGDIVVALINGEATVKRYLPQRSKVILQPANDNYQPIEVEKNSGDFRIAGKVVGLLRRLG
ncbi:transcriptional repressor LexA [bacterium]|nr:transcriptional repressor LexA [bacterium]